MCSDVSLYFADEVLELSIFLCAYFPYIFSDIFKSSAQVLLDYLLLNYKTFYISYKL